MKILLSDLASLDNTKIELFRKEALPDKQAVFISINASDFLNLGIFRTLGVYISGYDKAFFFVDEISRQKNFFFLKTIMFLSWATQKRIVDMRFKEHRFNHLQFLYAALPIFILDCVNALYILVKNQIRLLELNIEVG